MPACRWIRMKSLNLQDFPLPRHVLPEVKGTPKWKHIIGEFLYIWNLTRRSVFAINTTTSFHRSLMLHEWRSQIKYWFDFDFLLVLGQKWKASECLMSPCLYLCICIFAPVICAFQNKLLGHSCKIGNIRFAGTSVIQNRLFNKECNVCLLFTFQHYIESKKCNG